MSRNSSKQFDSNRPCEVATPEQSWGSPSSWSSSFSSCKLCFYITKPKLIQMNLFNLNRPYEVATPEQSWGSPASLRSPARGWPSSRAPRSSRSRQSSAEAPSSWKVNKKVLITNVRPLKLARSKMVKYRILNRTEKKKVVTLKSVRSKLVQ